MCFNKVTIPFGFSTARTKNLGSHGTKQPTENILAEWFKHPSWSNFFHRNDTKPYTWICLQHWDDLKTSKNKIQMAKVHGVRALELLPRLEFRFKLPSALSDTRFVRKSSGVNVVLPVAATASWKSWFARGCFAMKYCAEQRWYVSFSSLDFCPCY